MKFILFLIRQDSKLNFNDEYEYEAPGTAAVVGPRYYVTPPHHDDSNFFSRPFRQLRRNNNIEVVNKDAIQVPKSFRSHNITKWFLGYSKEYIDPTICPNIKDYSILRILSNFYKYDWFLSNQVYFLINNISSNYWSV